MVSRSMVPSWLLATKSMSSRRRTPRPRSRSTSARILSPEPASRLKLKAITWSGAVIVALLVLARNVADGTTRQRHRRPAHPRHSRQEPISPWDRTDAVKTAPDDRTRLAAEADDRSHDGYV